MLNIKNFVFNAFSENSMIVDCGTPECVLIDPGFHTPAEQEEYVSFLQGRKPLAILLTHAHLDHVFGVKTLQDLYDIPVYMNPAEQATIDNHWKRMPGSFAYADYTFTSIDIADGQILQIGPMSFDVIATPGHSLGSVCFLCAAEKVLFSGDTLFAGTIGRSDLPGGDYDTLIHSIMDKLMGLDGDVTIFPGHGGKSTIAKEAMTNPFLEPWGNPADEEFDPDAPGLEIHS